MTRNNEVFERDGDVLFAHACKLGCEGIVSRLGGCWCQVGILMQERHAISVRHSPQISKRMAISLLLKFSSLSLNVRFWR